MAGSDRPARSGGAVQIASCIEIGARACCLAMGKLRLLQASAVAEKAWMAEVVSVFGERDAGLARFQERASGEPGTRLRALYNHYVAARDAYMSVERTGVS